MDKPTIPHHHLYIGIGYILLCWLFSTIASPLIRIVNKELSMAPILLAQGVLGVVSVLPWMIHHGRDSFKTPNGGLVFFRALCGVLGFWFLFLAIVHTSLVDAYLLNNTAPLFVPFVTYFWLKKAIEPKLWPPLLGGFLGIIFILKPGAELINMGLLYGLANGILLSLIMVTLRMLSKTTRNHTVLFYFYLSLIICSVPFTLVSGTAPYGVLWIYLIIIGVLSALWQFCLIRAFHYASPVTLGPFNYSSVIFAGLLDWMIYGVRPDLPSWIGILLICIGGIWSIRQNKPPSLKRPEGVP